MKKIGFIAASLGTAVALAVGAAGVAHMVTHPREVVEEANAAEVAPPTSPPARRENAPARGRAAGGEARSDWGVLSFVMGDGARQAHVTHAPTPQQTAAPASPPRSSDDDDGGGD